MKDKHTYTPTPTYLFTYLFTYLSVIGAASYALKCYSEGLRTNYFFFLALLFFSSSSQQAHVFLPLEKEIQAQDGYFDLTPCGQAVLAGYPDSDCGCYVGFDSLVEVAKDKDGNSCTTKACLCDTAKEISEKTG